MIEALLAPLWAVVWMVAMVVNQLANFGITDSRTNALLGTSSLPILDATFTPILLGVAAAHLMHARRSFGIMRTLAGFPFAALVFAILIVALLICPLPDISGWFRLTFHLAITLLLAALLLTPNGAVARALSLRPVVYVGSISYGIYLYHFIALHAANLITRKLPLLSNTFVLTLLISIAIAAISYHLFEVRFLRLQRHFRSERPLRAPVTLIAGS